MSTTIIASNFQYCGTVWTNAVRAEMTVWTIIDAYRCNHSATNSLFCPTTYIWCSFNESLSVTCPNRCMCLLVPCTSIRLIPIDSSSQYRSWPYSASFSLLVTDRTTRRTTVSTSPRGTKPCENCWDQFVIGILRGSLHFLCTRIKIQPK